MALGILGRKIRMTQLFDDSGEIVPVTVIQAGPCSVLQVRTPERDGYEAVQIGFLDKSRRRARRSERGHVAKLDSKRARERARAGVEPLPKADCEPQRFVREIRGPAGDLDVGAQVTVDAFENVPAVDVTATSKGRGFAGAMKRHNFAGQRASHGVKKCHRHLGGTGCAAYPSRLFKGVRMAGRYGGKQTTVRNQKIVRIDPEHHLLIVKGAVPGPNGGLVLVRQTNKLGS